ncbi:MAG: lipoprotein signal peptidase [Pseudarcicella sp.]|nr:lipoprotein signal peptidase [Pseudarcicella sp.]MBP6410274.1 lipoprotein signal peptidase [Pseudarcicella sp.]
MNRSVYRYFLFALVLIVIDQAIKLLVNYNFQYVGNEWVVFKNILKLDYVLNPGMAFGMELEMPYGKLVLSVFRLVAMGIIAYILVKISSSQSYPNGLNWCVASILAGGTGNVLDSVFYGKLIPYNAIPYNPPHDIDSEWFHGRVIDMFSFFYNFNGWIPDWIPYFGGGYYSVPVFNFADACVFCGVMGILLFQKKFLGNDSSKAIEDILVENADNYEPDKD